MFSGSSAVQLSPEFRRWEKTVQKKGRVCTKCSSRHFDARHAWCEPCRIVERARHYEYYWGHKKAGLCTKCPDALSSTSRCEHHRAYHAAHTNRVYHEQREAGLCTYGRCPEPVDGAFCDKHAEMSREWKRNFRARGR